MLVIKDLFRITEGLTVYSFTSSNEEEILPINFASEDGSPFLTEASEYLILEEEEIFTPVVCGRSEFKDTVNYLKDTMDLTLPLMHSIAQHFIKSPIDYIARIECFSIDNNDDITIEWRGTLQNVKPDDKQCRLTFNSLFASNRTAGTRPVFQRSCRHTVYSGPCGVLFDSFKVDDNITAISGDGLTVTVASAALKPDGFYNAGVIVFPDGTKRYIKSHIGTALILIRYSPSLIEAWDAGGHTTVAVSIAPGCSQSIAWCASTFANQLNYGGFLNIPLNNPNNSSIV